MILKIGITGFCDVKDLKHLPATDSTHLHQIVEDLVAENTYNTKELLEPDYSSNYFRLKLVEVTQQRSIDILVNAQYPYYCAIDSEATWMNLNFIDVPKELQIILNKYFEYLSPELLNSSISQSDLSQLSKVEIEQKQYWDSSTIGEIIFNGYD